MTQKFFILNAFLLFYFGMTGIQAQDAIPASGGDASGSGGTTSYSIGQVVYTTQNGFNGSVAQGVQQPFEISIVTETEQAKNINLVFTVYPNPTVNSLMLNVGNYNKEKLSYQLYDISGKILENKKITDNETSISIENLARASYFLKVTNNDEEIKTFKIIKN